jgi:hypothetical protein
MKRLFFMLVLTFSTVTFFANEKTEALPVENEVATPDFSVESEYKQIRKQERQERRRIRRERRALRRSPEGKILRGHLARFFGFTSLALAVPYTVASVGYTYHVIPSWWEMIVNDVTGPTLGAILLPFTFLGGIFPVLISLIVQGCGIGFSVSGSCICQNTKITDSERFKKMANKHIKLYRNMVIPFGIVGGCFFTTILIPGIVLLPTSYFANLERQYFDLGSGFIIAGSLLTCTAFSFMFGALGAMAWLKGQTNRLSVDIGVTSGNSGELSCDKKRNALEKLSGVKLAMSVRF